MNRQPLLTLSPSAQSCFTGLLVPSENVWKSTPKLSRKESLDSVARFLLNDFSEFEIEEQFTGKRHLEPLKSNEKFDRETTISIHVSPSSPSAQEQRKSNLDTSANGNDERYLSISQLPFSPKLASGRSPVQLTPTYK
ncbi:hypothetical protein X975_24435, partial [Stegodyphus mimosarum]